MHIIQYSFSFGRFQRILLLLLFSPVLPDKSCLRFHQETKKRLIACCFPQEARNINHLVNYHSDSSKDGFYMTMIRDFFSLFHFNFNLARMTLRHVDDSYGLPKG